MRLIPVSVFKQFDKNTYNSDGRYDAADNKNLNNYWSFMHRQWGHQLETRVNEDQQVVNNLVVSFKA